MPRNRTTDVNNGADELLVKLLADFSYEAAVKWLRRKFSTFDSSAQKDLPLGDTKNDRDYFVSIKRLGYVTALKADPKTDINKPLVAAAIEMRKDLSERTSRSVQFNCAKRILKDEVERGQHGLTGLPSQGLFFFYDQLGHFRISLVSGEVENRRFKFNEAKRQSFFVEPEAPNNIVKRRLNVAFNTFADVKEAFSVEKLTKEFYNNLFAWYQWAMEPETGITFPNDTSKDDDDRLQLSEAMIRMVTRLMFVWFIRQKGLVPKGIFDKDILKKEIIRDFKHSSMEQDNYYRVILQNLFFATLNCQPEKRKFAKSYHGMSNEQGVKTCFRYSEELIDSDYFMNLMAPVPFLNCALFDCLDYKKKQDDETEKEILLDGFSTKRHKQAHVPNGLFFDDGKGLIKLFSLYEFTIDENNPDDSDVALDPELLGKVFENLLGAFNPETQETARKATGSFYTPREIVDYMVEESLKNYLKSKLPSADDERLNDLFDRAKAIDGAAVKFDKQETEVLLEALYNCKILDPACGSGAFPMGVLQCMVRLFSLLDPHNIRQREKLMERYREESEEISGLSDAERKERADVLEKQLKEGQHYPDYARKLYLIENCIYGVDIQPIATQISKLRFFISLLCDQLRSSWDPQAANYGLLSLPNLEAKFVCANTLLSLPKVDGSELALSADGIKELRDKLQKNRHRIFFARTAATKAKYKQRDQELRDSIKSTVRTQLYTPNQEAIALYQKLIETSLEERKAVAEPKIELQEEIVGGDLFTAGEKQWVEVDINAARRNELDSRINKAKQIIAEEYNKSRNKSMGNSAIEELAAMVAGWDPYDQNACSDFFDPEWMFNVKDGFDIVIGNPPYIDSETMCKNMPSLRNRYGEIFDSAVGNWDLFCIFVEYGVKITNDIGVTSFIVPNKIIAAKYAERLREILLNQTSIIEIRDYSKVNVFVEASIYPCTLVMQKKLFNPIANFSVMSDRIQIERTNCIKNSEIHQSGHWDLFFSDKHSVNIIAKFLRGTLFSSQENINVLGAATVGEAYKIKEFIFDAETFPDSVRVINTGTIDRYMALWGKSAMQYIKGRYIYPRVKIQDLRNMNETRLYQATSPKIIVAGMTKIIEAVYDSGDTLAGKSTTIILGDPVKLKYLLALLNSKLISFVISILYNSIKMAGGFLNIGSREIENLRLPNCTESQSNKLAELVDKIIERKKSTLEAHIGDLEKEIDNLVYTLYELTEEEIAIVEGCNTSAEPAVAVAPEKKTRKTSIKRRKALDDEILD